MHQNVSLRYLSFEQRPLSLFCLKAKSLHHTKSAGVKVFNPRPSAALLSSANPPGCLLVSQKSLQTFLVFGLGQKPDIVFPFRARQKHDRCPWKQHLCRCFQFFEDFRGFFFYQVRSVFTVQPCLMGRKGRIGELFNRTDDISWILLLNSYLFIIFNIKLKQCYNVLETNIDGLINVDLVNVELH